jgi:hypothetical protein
MEPATVDTWRLANSTNEYDDAFVNNLDRWWIDLGGEG